MPVGSPAAMAIIAGEQPRPAAGGSAEDDERLFPQALDPLSVQPARFIQAQGVFDFLPDFAQRLLMGGALLSGQEQRAGLGQIDDATRLSGSEGESDVGQFLAQRVAFGPAGIAAGVAGRSFGM